MNSECKFKIKDYVRHIHRHDIQGFIELIEKYEGGYIIWIYPSTAGGFHQAAYELCPNFLRDNKIKELLNGV